MNFQYGLLHFGANKFFALGNNYQSFKLLQILLLKTSFFCIVHLRGCDKKHLPLLQEKNLQSIGIVKHTIAGLITDLGMIDKFQLAPSTAPMTPEQQIHFTLAVNLYKIVDDLVSIEEFINSTISAIELKYSTTKKYMQHLVLNDSDFNKFFDHDERIEKKRVHELENFYKNSLLFLLTINYTKDPMEIFSELREFFNSQSLNSQIANHFKNKILLHESLQ